MTHTLHTLAKLSLFMLLLMSVVSGCKKDDDTDPDLNPTPGSVSNFCYTATKSTATYDTISGGVELTYDSLNSDDVYTVPLGFSFTFCDTTVDKLYIAYEFSPTLSYTSVNGFLALYYYELIPCGSISLERKWDSNLGDFASRLKYQITGSTGNRVATIEWREFVYEENSSSDQKTVNFIVKLYEKDNKISYHYGPNDATTDFTTDPFEQFTIGMYGSDPYDGLYLSGNSSNPTSNKQVGGVELKNWPAAGTVYTFNQK